MKHRVVLNINGRESRLDCGGHETVLDAMRRAGFQDIPRGCGGGGCGICKVRLVSGTVKETSRMSLAHITEEERDKGFMLACCVTPTSDTKLVFCGTKIGIAQKI